MSLVREKIVARNLVLQTIRDFFRLRNVLEVDTSLMRDYSVTDPYMSAFSVHNSSGKLSGFLQTSPEFSMKQLLCEGSGDIFQLSKMFRADELSPIHLPEFTMLEWYRTGFDHFRLITEVVELIKLCVGERDCLELSYKEAFIKYLHFDPFTIEESKLKLISKEKLGELPPNMLFDDYLTLLFSEKIEPEFDPRKITVIKDYPENQASLARTRKENDVVTADRFEVYCQGVELANGFYELTDPDEHRKRFINDNKIRRELGLSEIDLDTEFLCALKKGLPDCAGVALGVDRLQMIKQGSKSIASVALVSSNKPNL